MIAQNQFGGNFPARLLRGNIFGGSKSAVKNALDEFDTVLGETLVQGYMGKCMQSHYAYIHIIYVLA